MRPIHRSSCYRGSAINPASLLLLFPFFLFYAIVVWVLEFPERWREAIREDERRKKEVKSYRYLIGISLIIAMMVLFFGLAISVDFN